MADLTDLDKKSEHFIRKYRVLPAYSVGVEWGLWSSYADRFAFRDRYFPHTVLDHDGKLKNTALYDWAAENIVGYWARDTSSVAPYTWMDAFRFSHVVDAVAFKLYWL